MKNCDFPMKNGDFPMKNGDFPVKNGDFPVKNCDFPWFFVGWPHHREPPACEKTRPRAGGNQWPAGENSSDGRTSNLNVSVRDSLW